MNRQTASTRICGECTACCKALPVRSLGKGSNERCKHQRGLRGCAVYAQLDNVSPECRLWSCRWLLNSDTADLRRPDRSHYVVDPSPEFVTMLNSETGDKTIIPVVQIWVDPKYPNAHEDPALRSYLRRRAAEGTAALVRYSSSEGFCLFAPEMTDQPDFVVQHSNSQRETHSAADVARTLGMGALNAMLDEAKITEDSPALQAYMARKE